MNTTSNNSSFSAAERLFKSADSLDCALANDLTKKGSAFAPSRQGLLHDLGSLDSVFGLSTTDLSAALFDDWLSSDLEQAGFLAHQQDDSSAVPSTTTAKTLAAFSSSLSSSSSSCSDSEKSSSSSPLLSEEEEEEEFSPALGFDSITSDTDLIQSPMGLDSSTMGFFPDLRSIMANNTTNTATNNNNNNNNNNVHNNTRLLFGATAPSFASPAPVMPLTAEAVQHAAAALNIPWSKGLEEAVLAQSLLASFPMALALPSGGAAAAVAAVAPPAPAPAHAPSPSSPAGATVPLARPTMSLLPPLMPKQGASMTVAHVHDTVMDSPPATPMMSPLSPMTSTFLPMDRSSSSSSTPRMSLSILSSTEKTVPVPMAMMGSSSSSSSSVNVVKATTYKSTYRSASLLKRDREFDEPPSVLEGKDVADMDEVSLKRAKNTDAARRSRRKKLIKMESLEQRVAELEVENSMFETKLNEVELERSLLADKEQMQQARIQELEAVLAAMREKLYQ
ncbi:hypothetical protein BG004_002384 [Podila humilis]|nr:hypothetical protein BG004_002384 [Podila humilis]